MKLHLPNINHLKDIIEADPDSELSTKRYYSKIHKIAYVKKLKMVLKLLGNERYDNLLDLGFGSGILLSELHSHCNKLYGIDIHKNILLVKDMLNKENVDAELLSGNVLNLPFKDQSMDCIVCLSVLAVVDNVDKAISEVQRIAKYNAKIIIGAPVLNKITDFCYDKIIKTTRHRLYKSNHRKIINAIRKYLYTERILLYPSFMTFDYSLFFVVKAIRKP